MRRQLFFMIGLILLLPSLSFGAQWFVHSKMAPVFTQPSLSSEKIMVLDQGTKVTGIEKKGIWQQIRINGQIGWVYTLMLGASPPLTPAEVSSKELKQMSKTARRRPSAYASTAAARGLVTPRKRLGQKLGYDYNALKKMESYAADTEATLKFMQEREVP